MTPNPWVIMTHEWPVTGGVINDCRVFWLFLSQRERRETKFECRRASARAWSPRVMPPVRRSRGAIDFDERLSVQIKLVKAALTQLAIQKILVQLSASSTMTFGSRNQRKRNREEKSAKEAEKQRARDEEEQRKKAEDALEAVCP